MSSCSDHFAECFLKCLVKMNSYLDYVFKIYEELKISCTRGVFGF